MYEHNANQLIMPDEFFLPFGGQLNSNNRWVVIVSSNPLPHKGVPYMIKQKDPCNQLPKEIKAAFKELSVLKHLIDAKIDKKFGYTAAYLFQLVFVLLFHQ